MREASEATASQVSRIPGFKTIAGSKTRTYDAEKDVDLAECSICLVDFSVDDPKPLVELGCSDKHVFHQECLEGWIENNSVCPLCRQEIKVD